MIEEFLKKYSEIVKQLGQEAHDLFLAYLGNEMGIKSPSVSFRGGGEAFPDSEADFKSGQELEYKSGALFRSFNRRDKNTASSLDITQDRIELTVGSNLPYAEIHNRGGFIKSKGKMEKYFWYKYISSGNNYFKIMALAVKKNGGVNIKKTSYFDIATDKFQRDGFKRIYERLITELGYYVS